MLNKKHWFFITSLILFYSIVNLDVIVNFSFGQLRSTDVFVLHCLFWFNFRLRCYCLVCSYFHWLYIKGHRCYCPVCCLIECALMLLCNICLFWPRCCWPIKINTSYLTSNNIIKNNIFNDNIYGENIFHRTWWSWPVGSKSLSLNENNIYSVTEKP